MMNFKDVMEMTRDSGNRIAKNAKGKQDTQNIGNIIQEALSSDDPFVKNQSIGKLLSGISPEMQPHAVKVFQAMDQLGQQQKQRKAIRKEGLDPDLPPELLKEGYKQIITQRGLDGASAKPYSEMTMDELLNASSSPTRKAAVAHEIKRREDKPATKGRVEFEKKIYEDVQETLQNAPRVKSQFTNLSRMEDLIKKLSGATGYFRKQSAAEFNGLGVAALEAPIHALFGTNRLAKEKFKTLKEAFVPLASETRWTQRGKIAALRSFNEEAMEKIAKMQALYDQYGLEIPLEEVYKIQAESEALVDRAIAEGDGFKARPQAEQPQPFSPAQLPEQQVEQDQLPPVAPVAPPVAPPVEQPPIIEPPPPPPPPPPPVAPVEEPQPQEPTPPAKKTATDQMAEFMDTSDEFQQRFDKDSAHTAGVIGRGAAKAVGSTADMINWVGSLFSDSTTVDVAKRTKEAFGEEMTIEDLATKAYDFVTGDDAKPEDKLEEYIQSGSKIGTEFTAPLGLFGKGGRALMPKAAIEGFVAGTALQTAKDLELGPEAEMGALFLPLLLAKSPKALKQGYEIAKNPKMLLNMAKDFGNYVKSVPGKVKAIPGRIKAAPQKIYEGVKKKLTKPTARTVAKTLDLKKGELIAPGVEKVAKKARQPLSEVFSNERVNAIEAKMSQQAEGAKIYKPLFDEISKKNISKYEQVIAGHTTANPKSYMKEFNSPKAHKELKQSFFEAVTHETAATKAEFRNDFDKLIKARPKDARISPVQTRNLVKVIDESIESLKKGGTITKDSEPIRYLESFRERLTEVTGGGAERIKGLTAQIGNSENRIEVINSYGWQVKRDPAFQREIKAANSTIKEANAEINKLSNVGAKVEEIEKGYRKINKALNWNKKFEYKDVPRLKLRANIAKVIQDYGKSGKKTKKYSDLFQNLNARYSNANETILSDMAFKFLHGEDPELVKMWLSSPKGVNQFNKLISESDIFFKDLGETLKTAKAHEMVLPKIFNEQGRVKATIGKFSPRDKDLLHSLLGDRRYDSLMSLTGEFQKNVNKIDSYLNKSGTYVQASMDAKKLLKWSGFWDGLKGVAGIFTGRPLVAAKSFGKAGMKMWGSNQDKIYSMLLTDTEFQKALIEVVRDADKFKPNYAGIEKMAKIMKTRGIAMADVIKDEGSKQ